MKKILVICKIQQEILNQYESKIIYHPHLTEFSETEWEALIRSKIPDVVLSR